MDGNLRLRFLEDNGPTRAVIVKRIAIEFCRRDEIKGSIHVRRLIAPLLLFAFDNAIDDPFTARPRMIKRSQWLFS